MMINWIVGSLAKTKTIEMDDIRSLTQSDDFHANLALISQRILHILEEKLAYQKKLKSKVGQDPHENGQMKRDIRTDYKYEMF